MRTRKKDIHNLIKVGGFISGLTILLMIMIASVGKENAFFEKKVEIRARVDNVSNLKPGSYVELKGVRIGTVSNIEIISPTDVEVTMSVLKEKLKWIKQDSTVSVSTAGLVGDKYLEVFIGSDSSPTINPRKDVLVSGKSIDVKAMMSKGESIAEVTENILAKLDRILTQLDNEKSIVHMVQSMGKTSQNLEAITAELKEAKLGETFKKVNSSMNNMGQASASLSKVLARIENGPGTMNSLIYDDALYEDLRALMGGAARNKLIKYYIRESIKNSERKK